MFTALNEESFGGGREFAGEVAAYKERLHKRFPYATLFKDEADLKKEADAKLSKQQRRKEQEITESMDGMTIEAASSPSTTTTTKTTESNVVKD